MYCHTFSPAKQTTRLPVPSSHPGERGPVEAVISSPGQRAAPLGSVPHYLVRPTARGRIEPVTSSV
jgi:hypothetical protein